MSKVKIISDDWRATDWHGIEGRRRRWRVTDKGIELKGIGHRGSASQPELAAEVARAYRIDLISILDTYQLDPHALEGLVMVSALVGTACNESAGDPKAKRYEDHLSDYSFGLTQILTGTAHSLARGMGWPEQTAEDAKKWQLPDRPIPKGGKIGEWRRFLELPYNALLLAAEFHKINDKRFGLKGDPVLWYACYNAGSLRASDSNAWGIVHSVPALDSFCNFANDAWRYFTAAGDWSAS